MKLLLRLAFTIIAIALFAAAFIFYVTWTSNVKTLDTLVKKELEDLAFSTIDKIDRILFERNGDLKLIATDPIICSKESTPREITERLTVFRDVYKAYVSLSFFDLNSVRIADTAGLGLNQKHDMVKYWEDVLKGEISLASDVRFNEELKIPVIYFASLVKDKNGIVFGVVVARVPVDKLYELMGKVSIAPLRGKHIQLDLVNKDGILIYSDYNHQGILKDRSSDWEEVKRSLDGETIGIIEAHKHQGEEENITVFCRERGYLDFKGNDWTLIIHIPVSVVFEPVVALRNKWILVILPSIILTVIISLVFTIIYSKPLKQLMQATIELGKGNMDIFVRVKTHDEIGLLGEVFNQTVGELKKSQQKLQSYTKDLEEAVKKRTTELEEAKRGLQREVIEQTKELRKKARELEDKAEDLSKSQTAMLYMVEDLNKQSKELKDAQDKIVRSERLAAVGQLASSVAHELRNPLGVMKNVVYYLNMLELCKNNPDIKENLDTISQEIENSDRIISDLLDFSRIKKPTLQFEDINAIVKETLRRINVKTDVEMSLELDNNLPDIEVDALQIQQVFYNLANNALQSMDKGGRLKIKTSVQREAHSIERKEDEVQAASDERRETEFIEISFQDSGCGILKENLSKIFEPLFSTKAKGTGLGLSVCSSIIEGHGGKIEVESEAGRGSTFRVLLLTRQG